MTALRSFLSVLIALIYGAKNGHSTGGMTFWTRAYSGAVSCATCSFQTSGGIGSGLDRRATGDGTWRLRATAGPSVSSIVIELTPVLYTHYEHIRGPKTSG